MQRAYALKSAITGIDNLILPVLQTGAKVGQFQVYLIKRLCAGVVLLCVSGAVMWFKRRPAGGVGVPPLPAQRRALVAVTAMLVVGGVVFPLVGVSMVVLAVVDACVVWWGLRG